MSSISDLFAIKHDFYCLVDASWTASNQPAGIAWKLYSSQRAISPVSTSLEAEAIALKMAIQELVKFQYHEILFVGDCKSLYDALQNNSISTSILWCPVQVANEIKDISKLSSRAFHNAKFLYVPRLLSSEVDSIAKKARISNVMYTVKYF